MQSKKSSNVPWSIAIDNQKQQNFCLSCSECPGWEIKPIGFEKINVSDLDFNTYSSVENLRAVEENLMYPPRFKVAVIRHSIDKNLKTDFKVILENDGVLVSDQVRNFPLTIMESAKKIGLDFYRTGIPPSWLRQWSEIGSTITSNTPTTTTTSTTTTTITTTTTAAAATATAAATCSSSVTDIDISLASSYQSTTVSAGSSSIAIADVPSVSTICIPSTVDTTVVAATTELDQTALTHLPVSTTTVGNTFVKQNVIVQGGINIYQSEQPHFGVEQTGGSSNSLECFATDIQDNVDVVTILPNLISYGLLTPKQQSDLTHPQHTTFEKQQILRGIILQLNEKCVKQFLQCLSETSSYDPHKQLLDKICYKFKEETDV